MCAHPEAPEIKGDRVLAQNQESAQDKGFAKQLRSGRVSGRQGCRGPLDFTAFPCTGERWCSSTPGSRAGAVTAQRGDWLPLLSARHQV